VPVWPPSGAAARGRVWVPLSGMRVDLCRTEPTGLRVRAAGTFRVPVPVWCWRYPAEGVLSECEPCVRARRGREGLARARIGEAFGSAIGRWPQRRGDEPSAAGGGVQRGHSPPERVNDREVALAVPGGFSFGGRGFSGGSALLRLGCRC